ncbi:hypothetical protein LTS02_007829 [Friedmanniomyces endolithicus]|nr:hypothetical protein LTR03_001505 [Friedmanniomyces endolithicus]KAK0861476.1 hypothetical protein LTS02_007829 [Friedmanniomyces endolithicus]KAK0969005.1 hypothetical protein LTS01_016495 [Friedmanniomyces endolithicus]
MQPSARQTELEKLYQTRKASRGHVPQISISDDNHHVTEAIGSYYGDEHGAPPGSKQRDNRPLSFMPAPSEVYESRGSKRGGGYFDPKTSPTRNPNINPMERTRSGEKTGSPTETGTLSPKALRKASNSSKDAGSPNGSNGGQTSPPPALSRQGSNDTAVQQFPLNDIDYESSPAAVAQELSNLQAIRRMSMSVDTGDPDLAGFGGIMPTSPKRGSDDEDDPSRLFWVPARLHPELAPKEFKTFVEDRVDKIRRRSGDSENLSVDGLERSGSGSSSLRRKKSMLSRQIDPKSGQYEDGAERLERKRSKRMQVEAQTTVANLEELESLVNDPQQLMRRMSLDTVRRSQDSGIEVPATEDMPILPPGGQTLKRSTRTTYRKGSLKRGERVPFSKRVQSRRHSGSENGDETGAQSPVTAGADEREPILGLTRVQTEPTPLPSGGETQSDYHSDARHGSRRRAGLGASQSTENLQHEAEAPRQIQERRRSPPREPVQVVEQQQQQPQRGLQARPFTSRLASGGRTTAQLPGYNNPNPLPHIIETLPDGTKVPVGPLAAQAFPERRSSHEHPRPPQRGGAHMRPVPGRQQAVHTSTLDDISSNPSPLPGSGSTRTDALTMVPTFEDKKVERKESMRKSSWKWILGNDDDDREKEKKAVAKEEKAMGEGGTASSLKARASKLTKTPTEKARLDVLQNSIDGTTPSRGRESIVLNRADIQLEDERKKESKKSMEIPKKEREKDSGLLSAIFGGKKKSFDGEQKEKKRKSDRGHSPEPPTRILKPDIDYNWTRFSILEERAIYRMAHIKLANPRRALYSQVLLSNFMYSYLAKVQALHPQMQIPASQQQKAAQQQQQQQQQQSKSDQPAEYSQYQRWQEQQSRQEPDHGNGHSSARNSGDGPSSAGASSSSSSSQQQRTIYDQQYRSAFDHDNGHASGGGGHDQRSAEEYENSFVQVGGQQYSREAAQARVNGIMGAPHHSGGGGGGGGGGGPSQAQQGAHGYSVASTHDYLGYPKDQQPFGTGQEGLWDDEEKAEELW